MPRSPALPPPSPTQVSSSASERSALAIAFLALVALVVLSQLYGALVLGRAAATTFDAGSGAAGLVQAAFGAAYAIGFIVWGPFVDRLGGKRILLLGLSTLVLTTGFVAFAPGMPWLIVGRVAQGFAAASFAPAAFAYFGATLPTATRITATTVLTSSFLAATVLGQVAAQAITDTLSWRWFFGISAILLIVAFGVAPRILRADPAPPQTTARPFAALCALLCTGKATLLLLSTIAILSPFIALYAALAQAGRYDSGAMLALRLSALPALTWAGFASAWLGRLTPTARLIIGFTGAAAASLTLAFTGTFAWGISVCMFAFAACVSLLAPAMIQALTGMAPAQRGSTTALYTFALFLGASIAPVLVNALAATDPAIGLLPSTALLAVPVMLAAAAISAAAGRSHKSTARWTLARGPKGTP